MLLPTIIAEYRAGTNTGVRLRMRRLFGGVRDFELLSPIDTFVSPLNNLPMLDGIGTGTSFELEGDHISFFFNSGYTSARDTDANRDIANVPRWTGEVGLFYLHTNGWFVQPSLFYQGARFRSDRSRAESFSAVNLRVGKRFGLRGMAFIELRNAFDESYDILDVEQQGRQLRAGFSGRF